MYVYEAHARAGRAHPHRARATTASPCRWSGSWRPSTRTTLLVPLSHVVFRSGSVQDVAAITRRAHEVGALVVADLYQSAGTVPVDVAGLGRGLRHRRLGEVAVRRARRRLPLRGAAAAGPAAPARHRLGGARATRSLSSRGRSTYARGRRALPARHAGACPRSTPPRAGYDDRGARRRGRDPAPSPCGRCGSLVDLARERGLPRAHARAAAGARRAWWCSTCPTARRSRASCCAARCSWTTVPARASASRPHFYTSDDELRRVGRRDRARSGTRGPDGPRAPR